MRNFDWSSFKRTTGYSVLAGAFVAIFALLADGAFVREVFASAPDWLVLVIVTFVANVLAGLARAKDGRTFK